jgi:hypothetical protein
MPASRRWSPGSCRAASCPRTSPITALPAAIVSAELGAPIGSILAGRVSAGRRLAANAGLAREPSLRLRGRSPRRIALTALRASLFARWPAASAPADGYTILVPMPADLPVFLELMLAGFAAQNSEGHAETLIVPDRASAAAVEQIHRIAGRYQWGPVRVVQLPARGRLLRRVERALLSRLEPDPLTRALRAGVLTHFLQIYSGIAATATTHAILHDADLFLLDPAFLRDRFRRCRELELGWLGAEPRLSWDREAGRLVDLYGRDGLDPVSNTWELIFDVPSLRRMPPWWMHAQSMPFEGAEREFDTLDYPQIRSPVESRQIWETTDAYVHFHSAIWQFRTFQETRRQGRTFSDEQFRVLLISLLSDCLVGAAGSQEVPDLRELTRGIEDDAAPVTYRSEAAERNYAEFRRLIAGVIGSPLITAGHAEELERSLRPFDAAFA